MAISADALYATVYAPDKTQNDPSEFDQEAWDYWAAKFKSAGLDPKIHIVNGKKKDNFWMMGETGPCGPCSEIHVDLTPRRATPKARLVNKGDARCIEIWNLVFIQFNANPDGTFSPLPARHVDTGMGFERVTRIIQGTNGLKDFANAKISNYETDIFRPIFDALENLSGKRYGSAQPGKKTPPRALSAAPANPTPVVTQTKDTPRIPPRFERQWAKYMVTFFTRDRRQLTAPERDLVLKSVLSAHDNHQYLLYAACVMPNHVHLLFEPQIKEKDKGGQPVFWPVSEILQRIKSDSAHNIYKASGGTEQVWEKESMNRMIHGQGDMEDEFYYICQNPWDTGAVSRNANYPWLSTPGPVAVDDASSADAPIKSSGEFEGRIIEVPETPAHPGPAGDDKDVPDDPEVVVSSEQNSRDIAFRVIADHIRTLSFAIADGIQPSNEGRGYVLRRILRRAVRYGRTLDFHEPFFYKLVDVLAETMGDVFNEIRSKRKHVQDTIRVEEESFNKTLDRGIELFNEQVGQMPEKKPISGEFAFQLYDTYGFPLDLTELMARERGLTVDTAGFEKLMEEQRERGRAAQKKTVITVQEGTDLVDATRFVGYDETKIKTRVLKVIPQEKRSAVVLAESPFYAEMGGQVGDLGIISLGAKRWRVLETKKMQSTWLHIIEDGEPPRSDRLTLQKWIWNAARPSSVITPSRI